MARLDYGGLQRYDGKIKQWTDDLVDTVVEVQAAEPSDETNKIWISTSEEEFTLAEMSDINELKSSISIVQNESAQITGCRYAAWEDKCRIQIPDVGETAMLTRTSASAAICCVMDIDPGEILFWSGVGGTTITGVAWGFIDEDNKVLERAAPSFTGEVREVAPANSKKVILNNRYAAENIYAFIGTPVVTKVLDAQDAATNAGIGFKSGWEELVWNKQADMGIRYNNGEEVSSRAFAHTNFVLVAPYRKIRFMQAASTSNISVGMAFYNAKFEYVDGVQGFGNQSSTDAQQQETDVPENAVYARFTFRPQSGSYSGPAFSVSGYGEIQCLENSVGLMGNAIKANIKYNAFDLPFTTVGLGAVKNEDGEIATSSAFYYTDYVDISLYKKIEYLRAKSTGGANTGAAFYDVSKGFISSIGSIGHADDNYPVDQIAVVPNNAVYARFTYRADTETYGNFYVKGLYNLGTNKERVVKPLFRSGRINDDMSSSPDSTRLRGVYTKFGNELKITVPSGYKIKVFEFSGTKAATFLSTTGFLTESTTIATDPAFYYRLMIGKTDDSDITVDEADNFTFTDYAGEIEIGSTGDSTDRTDEIEAYLSTYKCLKFGAGEFYFSSFDLGGGMLVGSGTDNTKLIFKDESDPAPWYAIKVQSNGCIKDLTIEAYTEEETIIPVADYSLGIHAIAIGRNDGSSSSDKTLDSGIIIENVNINYFSGCGIFNRLSSQGMVGCSFKNVIVGYCSAGFYIGYLAEYNTLIGCRAYRCYTGLVMVGANHIVSGCDFGENEVNINLPGSDGYDDSFGSAGRGIITGCKLTHAGYYDTEYPDEGYAILCGNQGSAELISNCFFGGRQAYVKDRTQPLTFLGCHIRGEVAESPITADNCRIIMSGCFFEENVNRTELNNGHITLKGCCLYNGTDVT